MRVAVGTNPLKQRSPPPRPSHRQPLPPTDTPNPTPDPEVSLVIAGEEEIVFDWTTDRCEDLDIPDLPARAFRNAAGEVILVAPHDIWRYMTGPDLNNVTKQCNVVKRSTANPDPANFADKEWLSAVYTEDGQTFYGIIHNEYHGWEHGQCSAPEGEHFQCWYNAMTLAVSTDGGASWQHAAAPPNHVIATIPVPYEDGTGPYGIYAGTQVVEKDGYYYQFVKAQDQTLRQWTCLMRTPDITDPSAWRFWDGADFNGEFVNPYVGEIDDPANHTCPPIAIDQIGAQLVESLTYNTELERYVLVGISADHIDGREVWGFYFSLSEDLINWTHRKLIMEVELPWTWEPGDGSTHLYPSLLDPDSTSLNFDTTDNQAYLYFTRFNEFHLDRDLFRVPVEFVVTP